MDIDCDINIEDMVEFNVYILSHQPPYKKQLKSTRIVLIICAVLFALLGIIMVLLGNIPTLIAMFAAALFLIIYYWFQFSHNGIRSRIRKTVIKQYSQTPNEEICRHRLSISKEGLHESTDFANTFTDWSAFDSIIQTDNYLYFFLRPGKGYLVPKRAFTDDTAFNLFVNKARNYMSNISS